MRSLANAALPASLLLLANAAPLDAQSPSPSPAAVAAPASSPAPAASPGAGESLYSHSLHFTNRGITVGYSKEHGGLERLTGFPAERLGCTKASCHVTSCDPCHEEEKDGRRWYSADAARSERACARCHTVDPADPDVHVRAGLKCMSCHTAREIHGDGVPWDSYNQPAAMDVRCERCHQAVSRTAAHTVHGTRLDCSACHVRPRTTCFNCHIGARLAGLKNTSIKREGLLFLVNHDGRVGPASFRTYVYGKGTMVTLAPTFPHAVTRAGRACADCHGTGNVREVAAGTLVLSRFVAGNLEAATGVIPVVEGMKWNVAFLDREGDRWVPLANPEAPLVNFSWCTPLSREQLARLQKPQPAR